jgi:hypothetical protein
LTGWNGMPEGERARVVARFQAMRKRRAAQVWLRTVRAYWVSRRARLAAKKWGAKGSPYEPIAGRRMSPTR